MRRDFIRGTIADDVFNYQIYTHILSGEYAARAKDLRTYAATSKVPPPPILSVVVCMCVCCVV